MPQLMLPQQTGNSCAAHCTVIAAAEILGTTYCLSTVYAEEFFWPQIQFKGGEGDLSDMLHADKNSDPRRIVSDATVRWGGLTAAIICDETEKARALGYVSEDIKAGLEALFNMMKDFGAKGGTNSVPAMALQDDAYYNASFLMMLGPTAESATFKGLHNILVAKEAGLIYYYNPNEDSPRWRRTSDWKTLNGQNGGAYSYVFTGVCIEMKHK